MGPSLQITQPITWSARWNHSYRRWHNDYFYNFNDNCYFAAITGIWGSCIWKLGEVVTDFLLSMEENRVRLNLSPPQTPSITSGNVPWSSVWFDIGIEEEQIGKKCAYLVMTCSKDLAPSQTDRLRNSPWEGRKKKRSVESEWPWRIPRIWGRLWPTNRTNLFRKEREKRWFESRRHDDVDDERLRLRRLKDEARNIAGDENKDRRVDYNNSLPAGCLERKRSSFPAGWSHREAASGHHGPPPVGSPEWQPRLQRQQ